MLANSWVSGLLFATTLALVIEAAVALEIAFAVAMAVDLVVDLVVVVVVVVVVAVVAVVAVALALSIALVFLGHRKTVEGGGLWVHGTLSAMDGATEPTRVRAHCLRGTASHASERTAASGWAGPRSGTCGVSRESTDPHPPR
ncbi:hypothetical protein [Stenotrophomonas rhizophila]|uniref:hypothetical protein n=1 Tax=Stenotrophomonas rhizophila TaxID=216778 RepID=UPI0028AD4A11|nr:hypothetical protein [Stenotrophomonas rhizophila]